MFNPVIRLYVESINLLFSFLILVIGSCLGVFVNIYPDIVLSELLIQLLILSLIPSFFALRNVYKVLNLTEYKLWWLYR